MSTFDLGAQLRATAPTAPESLRARVLALEPPARRRSRRLALVVVPAAAALAVVAAVVHGIVGSGTPQREVSHGAAVSAPPTQQALKSTDSAHAFRAVVTTPNATAGTPAGTGGLARTAPVPKTSRLQHTDASLEVRVGDQAALSKATTAAVRIVTSLGGYAQSVDYRTPQGGDGAATIELRVPAQNVRQALARLAGLGTLVSQELSVTDLQQRFVTESAQIAQLRRRIAALAQAVRDPALPDAQRVLLRIKLAESKRALSQRLHARKGTVAAGTTASVSLVLGTQKSIVPVTHTRGRLGRLLHSAVGFLALEGTIALYALIVTAPVAALVAVAWWLARLRRRREEAVSSTA